MDIKICRKCLDSRIIDWDVCFYPENRPIITISKRASSNIICTQRICVDSTEDKEINKKNFNSFRLVDKECPFYTEHTLHDWSG